MSKAGILSAIAVSAVITFFLRALPFLAFRNGKRMPDKLIYLEKNLPSSIMAVLIVYCLKDVAGDFGRYGVPELVSVLLVAVSYKWKHNTLLSITLGTACNMILLQIGS